jgi:nucleotide-binding universal stress UspA family protein
VANHTLVLTAIDARTSLERTVGFALTIAKRDATEVHAIEVVSNRGAAHVDDWNPPPLARDSGGESKIKARLAPLRKSAELDGVALRTVTLSGQPERAIPAYAQLHEASLLIVERDYGSSRFWRTPRVVGELSRRCPMPLLVLPPIIMPGTEAAVSLNRILAPVDFSIASAVALRTARDVAQRHGAGLILLHALENAPPGMVFSGSEAGREARRLPSQTRAAVQRLERQAAAFGVNDVTAQVVTGVPNRAITDAAKNSEADLVVMGVTPRSWIDRTFFGSTLIAVLRRATVPVLVVPVVAGDHEWRTESPS